MHHADERERKVSLPPVSESTELRKCGQFPKVRGDQFTLVWGQQRLRAEGPGSRSSGRTRSTPRDASRRCRWKDGSAKVRHRAQPPTRDPSHLTRFVAQVVAAQRSPCCQPTNSRRAQTTSPTPSALERADSGASSCVNRWMVCAGLRALLTSRAGVLPFPVVLTC